MGPGAVSHLHRQTQSQAVAPAAAAGELRQPHLEGEDRLAGNGPGAATVRAYHDAQPKWRDLDLNPGESDRRLPPTSRSLAASGQSAAPTMSIRPTLRRATGSRWPHRSSRPGSSAIIRRALSPPKRASSTHLVRRFSGRDRGLLVLHSGTQSFRMNEQGVLQNLAMREWESHFTRNTAGRCTPSTGTRFSRTPET